MLRYFYAIILISPKITLCSRYIIISFFFFLLKKKMNVMLMSLPNLYVNTFTPSVILLDVEPLEGH